MQLPRAFDILRRYIGVHKYSICAYKVLCVFISSKADMVSRGQPLGLSGGPSHDDTWQAPWDLTCFLRACHQDLFLIFI